MMGISLDDRDIPPAPACTISVVSHGHGQIVMNMLESLACSGWNEVVSTEVLLTLNIPEPELLDWLSARSWPFMLRCFQNVHPKGFGANQNQACNQARGAWFCVLNPDILWPKGLSDEHHWQRILREAPADVGLFIPDQVDIAGCPQDHLRDLITPWGLAWRIVQKFTGCNGASGDIVNTRPERADWVNGACMLFRRDVFAHLNGFDARYFMYCEDVDICLRLQLAGFRMAHADFTVIHDAQRNTTRNASHLAWHITSLIKFWTSLACWRYGWWKFSGKPPIKRQTTKSASH